MPVSLFSRKIRSGSIATANQPIDPGQPCLKLFERLAGPIVHYWDGDGVRVQVGNPGDDWLGHSFGPEDSKDPGENCVVKGSYEI